MGNEKKKSCIFDISVEQFEALKRMDFKSPVQGVRIFTEAPPRSKYKGDFVTAFSAVISLYGDTESIKQTAIMLGYIEPNDEPQQQNTDNALGISLLTRLRTVVSGLFS